MNINGELKTGVRLENKVNLSESIWERMGRGLDIGIGDGSGVCFYIY